MSRKIALFLTALSLSASAYALDNRPLEPLDLPPSVEQGVDMIYIDQELAPSAQRQGDMVHDADFGDFDGAPLDFLGATHPLYTDLRRGLVRYEMDYGSLPQVKIPEGPALKLNSTGDRVALLRQRLGLPEGTKFDAALAEAVKKYQSVHGFKADGIAGNATIGSLNLGYKHYESVLLLNLERARRLPRTSETGRYILVDAGSAKLWMYENGRPVDSMRVIVGSHATETPMMAAQLKYLSLNPWWNTPPELVQSSVAPGVI